MTKKMKMSQILKQGGNNQRLWSSISEDYNDLANDKVYGVFTFVEDEQIGESAKQLDVTSYLQLDWINTTTWFKEIVADYEVALNWFTKLGKHQPNFYGFCKKKPQIYYYRLYAESKPNLHKAFSVTTRGYPSQN